jgi:hypothetical protein
MRTPRSEAEGQRSVLVFNRVRVSAFFVVGEWKLLIHVPEP